MKLSGARNQCQGCKQYFNSMAAFEKHRVGILGTLQRRCSTTLEMTNKGMFVNADGFWVTKMNYRIFEKRVPPTSREAGDNREADQLATKVSPHGESLEEEQQ